MITAILVIATAVCGFGWLNQRVCCTALIFYIQEKNGTLPSDEEMKVCLTEAWMKTLRIK